MTISVAKRKGTNAIVVADKVLEKVEALKGTLVPGDVTVTVTRNYGETAAEKSNELLLHMLIAVISVSVLIWITLGLREAGIVAIAIPVTLALTLAVFYLYGYTLNRVTLFALIFSIGILVDDAIVVVENIVRHYRLPENRGRSVTDIAVEAVDEVGQPHDPRHVRRHRRDPSDGVRPGPDGAVHAADPGGRDGGDALLAPRRLRRHALGRGPAAPEGSRGSGVMPPRGGPRASTGRR